MSFVFPPPATPSLAVVGEEARFPIRRIYCVGRNYAAHAREMGHDPSREQPFFFSKPADAIVENGATVPYPPLTSNLAYEAELVVAIGAAGSNVPPEAALGLVFGYGVGIDLTRRDLQAVAKDAGRPWEWGKSFDNSAPCSALRRLATPPQSARIWLTLNGDTKQDATTADMIWDIPHIISFLTASVAVAPGDLIFTGTPEGVGKLNKGDAVHVGVEGVGELDIRIG